MELQGLFARSGFEKSRSQLSEEVYGVEGKEKEDEREEEE